MQRNITALDSLPFVRYEGPQGCTINWAPDRVTHQAILKSGQKGIHLEVPGQQDLTLVSGGGVAAAKPPA